MWTVMNRGFETPNEFGGFCGLTYNMHAICVLENVIFTYIITIILLICITSI